MKLRLVFHHLQGRDIHELGDIANENHRSFWCFGICLGWIAAGLVIGREKSEQKDNISREAEQSEETVLL
jgi:hypothetical protein